MVRGFNIGKYKWQPICTSCGRHVKNEGHQDGCQFAQKKRFYLKVTQDAKPN